MTGLIVSAMLGVAVGWLIGRVGAAASVKAPAPKPPGDKP